MESLKRAISFIFFPGKIIVNASQGQTILEAVSKQGLELDHSCGGMGTCGTCRVWIDSSLGVLLPRNEVESEMALERGFQSNERLACQTCAVDGVHVRRPT